MCYYMSPEKLHAFLKEWSEKNQEWNNIKNAFDAAFTKADPPMTYNAPYLAMGKAKPQITVLHKTAGSYRFENMQWSLELSFSGRDGTKTYELVNSMCEKVFKNHADIIYSQRCVIPIKGYFEFYHKAGQTYPMFIRPKKDEDIVFLAGVWKEKVNTQTGEVQKQFSVITTPPNAMARKIHNSPKAPNGPRMPLILEMEQVPEYLDNTLKKEQIQEFLQAFPDEKLKYHPVWRFLKKENVANANSAQSRMPVEYPDLGKLI